MSFATPSGLAPLTCPECVAKGRMGICRMGNRRAICKTCNRFVQVVVRRTGKHLAEKYPEDQKQIRQKVEMDIWPQFVEEYRLQHPVPRGEDIDFDENGMPIFNA